MTFKCLILTSAVTEAGEVSHECADPKSSLECVLKHVCNAFRVKAYFVFHPSIQSCWQLRFCCMVESYYLRMYFFVIKKKSYKSIVITSALECKIWILNLRLAELTTTRLSSVTVFFFSRYMLIFFLFNLFLFLLQYWA